jgi:site-specific DNA-methyltransferase (adenine-specific)
MNNIIHGDCLDVMKKIPDGIIDMVLCDLPYQTTSCKWDQMIPLDLLWEQYKRIIKDNRAIVLTSTQPFTTDLINSNREWFKYEWIWYKNFGANFVQAKRQPLKYHENILVFSKSQHFYNPIFEEYSDSFKKSFESKEGHVRTREYKSDYIYKIKPKDQVYSLKRGRYPISVRQIKGVHRANNTRLHPSQKPLELFEYLIKTYTNEGDLILDNCIGSGTTAIAALNINRNFIGIEKEEKYVEIARQRIKETLISGQEGK